MEEKHCNTCSNVLHYNGKRLICKSCQKEYNAKRYREPTFDIKICDKHGTPRTYQGKYARCFKCQQERNAAYQRKRHTKVNDATYQQMLAAQNFVCAICKQPETRKAKKGFVMQLSVDHNHSNGKVRELLCHSCNQALGLFKDNRELLLSAVDYLDRHSDLL